MAVMDTKVYWNGMQDLSDFFINGYQVFHETDLDHENISKIIGDKYLSPIFGNWKLVESCFNDRIEIDDCITVWHNDSKFGMNITFLYYLDDMHEQTGGAIFISNGIEEMKIYPKRGTLIMLSQHQNMKHKVEFTNKVRRMFNIDYYVEGY